MSVYDCRPHLAGEVWKGKSHRSFQEFVFEENSDRKIALLLWFYHFEKATFSKYVSRPHALIEKSFVFKLPRFEESFEKLRFRDGLVWDRRRDRRN